MTSVPKNVCIDKLNDRVNKPLKNFDVKPNMYIGFNKENKKEGPKSKFGDVRISKYKNTFAKGYFPNWCKEGFVFKRLKIPRQGHMLLVI